MLEPFYRGEFGGPTRLAYVPEHAKRPASVHADLRYFVIENENHNHFGGDERT